LARKTHQNYQKSIKETTGIFVEFSKNFYAWQGCKKQRRVVQTATELARNNQAKKRWA
jgi:hypothetical protein